MRVTDTEITLADAGLLLSGHDLSCVKSEPDKPCLSSESSHSIGDHNSSFIRCFDKVMDIDYLDINEYLNTNERWNIEADRSSRFDHVLSLSMVHWNSDKNQTNILDDDEHEACIYSMPCNVLSQDDCVNSKSHPRLFASRYPQSWCVRCYKFQVGLINAREASRQPN